MAPQFEWMIFPALWYFTPVHKEMAEAVGKAIEQVETTVYEGWRDRWIDILIMVHSAATKHTDTVPDPKEALRWQKEGKLAEYYRWTFDSVMRNAANYLALSSLLGLTSSLVSLGRLLAIAKTVFR